MEIKDALAQTRAEVTGADLPERWGDLAFSIVLQHLLDKPPQVRQSVEPVPASAGPSDTGSGIGRLAARLAVSEHALADVFAIEGDGVTLHVASARISPTKSRATREVALLMAAARQGAEIDVSWTDISHVRDTLIQYSRYDQSNFAKYVRDAGGEFNFRGRPIQQLRLTRPGWEAAEALIKSLAGSA